MEDVFTGALIIVVIYVTDVDVGTFEKLARLGPFTLSLVGSCTTGGDAIFFGLELPGSMPCMFATLEMDIPVDVVDTIISRCFTRCVININERVERGVILNRCPAT